MGDGHRWYVRRGRPVRPARRGGGEADLPRAEGGERNGGAPRRFRGEGLGDPARRDPYRGGSPRRTSPPQGKEVVDLPHPSAAGRRRPPDRRGGGRRAPRGGPQGAARKRRRLL